MFHEIQSRVPATPAGAREAERLAKELPSELIESTCKVCPLLPTKTGNEPPQMQFVINEVSRLENKKAIGVQLGVLTPFQEAILIGAQQGRNRSDVNRHKKNQSNSNSPPEKLQIPEGQGRLD